MREYSEVFDHYYNSEEALVIVNMKQNYFYLSSPLSKGKLMDVSPGRDEKVIFTWQRSKEMNELYKQWCERKPKNENKENNYKKQETNLKEKK